MSILGFFRLLHLPEVSFRVDVDLLIDFSVSPFLIVLVWVKRKLYLYHEECQLSNYEIGDN